MADIERIIQARPGRITMTQEESETFGLKDLLRRFYNEVATQGNVERIREFLTPDCMISHPLLVESCVGLDGLVEVLKTYRQAFPDIRYEMTDVIVEDGHKAAVRAMVSATHSGPWLTTAPTHKAATWTTTAVFHFHHGKISRLYVEEDLIGMMRQLGIDPLHASR